MTLLAYTLFFMSNLKENGLHIAKDNPRRAISYVRELRAQCRKITQAPQAYRPRTELGKGMRSCAHGNYVVLFYEEPGLVLIFLFFHGAMDIEAQFAEKNSAPAEQPT